MNYTLFVARRYLTSKRKTGFIAVIANISIAGVALGTAALIVTLCIISGFEKEMKARFVSFDAHVRVKTFEGTPPIRHREDLESRLRNLPHVTGVSPYVEKEAMIRSRRVTDGIMVKGIDATVAGGVLNIEKDIIASVRPGRLVLARADTGLPGIVIGKKLADRLYAVLGDRLTLFSLQNTLTFIQQPKVLPFRVTGIYRSGLAEYDNVFVYVDLPEAQRLFEFGETISGFELKLDDMEQAGSTAHHISSEFGYPYFARTWFDLHRNLFGWLETNNLVMMIIFGLIILVAAFNIVGTLFMIVVEKTRDIGVLRSMGARVSDIRRIFLVEGGLIGGYGALFGAALALALCLAQKEFRIIGLNSDIYFMDAVPVEIGWSYFVIIMALALALCIAAAVFPALRAARLDPVEAIRYE